MISKKPFVFSVFSLQLCKNFVAVLACVRVGDRRYLYLDDQNISLSRNLLEWF